MQCLPRSGRRLAVLTVLALVLGLAGPAGAADTIRVGIIGLDTPHARDFTKIFNDAANSGDLAGVKVVAAYVGGSPDVPQSVEFMKTVPDQMKAMGVEIVPTIEELLKRVDAVCLESLEGRPHLAQARPVLEAHKPLFVDKPVAASLADCIEIFRLAEQHKTPCFASSSLRFSAGILGKRNDAAVGQVRGCTAYSNNSPIEPSHPDLFYYGIHGVETLFTIMGPGCKTVSRVKSDSADLAVGVWSDGRVGTFRGIKEGARGFGATVFGSKTIAQAGPFEGYKPLLVEIAKFFKTGKSPVDTAETLEIYAFMEAADESLRQGGKPVAIDDVIEKAKSAKR